MSSTKGRGIAAELSIGLLVCGAAFYYVVRPTELRVAETRARAEALIAQGVGAQAAGSVSIDELKQMARDVSGAARALHDRGRGALDEAGMFSLFTELASSHNLRIDQLQPNAGPGRASKPAAGAATGQPPPPDDRSVGFTLTVRGDFGQIAAFLREVPRRFPNTAISGVRVSSTNDPESAPVMAIVTTNHWVFDALPAARLADAALAIGE